ncbi:MAG: methyltransferase domain-containing protein [Candidatus Pacebacteria bacterium]|jgi:SAM-dependent methyltransferase|nr:methyltransferase domain-containing protein [Candidatus Paceibacterota bacterium]
MAKRPFIRKQKKKQHGVTFWDNEYKNANHLKLSTDHSEDLEKFTRWIIREKREDVLTPPASVLDVGCGNGRNLIFLARQFGLPGIGYDISTAAVAQAKAASAGLDLTYQARSIAGSLELPDNSQTLVLDMMTSHFLNEAERKFLRDEIFRVLRPGGFVFMKTFLADGDLHTRRLLKDAPAKEENTYIHPVIGVPEYVYSEEVLTDFLAEKFIIHKVYRSHKHVLKGRARKRRTVSIYAEKDWK